MSLDHDLVGGVVPIRSQASCRRNRPSEAEPQGHGGRDLNLLSWSVDSDDPTRSHWDEESFPRVEDKFKGALSVRRKGKWHDPSAPSELLCHLARPGSKMGGGAVPGWALVAGPQCQSSTPSPVPAMAVRAMKAAARDVAAAQVPSCVLASA